MSDVNHEGYDFSLPEGTPVLAAADGMTVFAGLENPFFCPPLNRTAQGLGVVLEHIAPNGARYQTSHGHFSRVDVHPGQAVVTGQQIGLSGNTGCSGGPHLHYEVFQFDPVTRLRITTDPYGWEGSYPDPWEIHPQGAKSIALWKDGSAPVIFREVRLPPNPSGSTAPVTLTAWRWLGGDDAHNPNNEFVEITLDARFAGTSTRDLTGFTLWNNRGDVFSFPSGFHIQAGKPVLVYTGPGASTDAVLFWGRGAGVWDNLRECARLVYPSGGAYRLGNASGACD
jgi:Peptidase family M23/Lamin Tail Domain